MNEHFLDGRVTVVVGDITSQRVDAIVNAANSSLMGGGGVDGAIHRAGGRTILAECKELRRTQYPQGLPTGEAVITSAGNLLSKFVIHTVGPVYGQHAGREAELLAACYTNSLQLAINHALSTIAFPAISTGVYGYPLHQAAAVSSEAIKTFLSSNNEIKQVRLVFFRKADAELFLKHHVFARWPPAVEVGLTIADLQLPIANWYGALQAIGNRQLAMGNGKTHPLPQEVLTSFPMAVRF